MQATLLIVEDERNMQRILRMELEDAGYRVLAADSAEAALPLLDDPELALVLTDLKLPGMRGEELVARSRALRPEVAVIVLTAFGSIRSAIQCLQAGASDYLTKPFESEELLLAVESGLRLTRLMQENQRLHAQLGSAQPSRRLIGDSAAMRRVREAIAEVAPYRSNVLIVGESGTGKELIARSIHEQGPRADAPWVALNCSAIPHDLMESELFGYVRGAFTGAAHNRMGRIEQAGGGTLFLDEIGDLELALQGKLLRVLQEREYSPVGSDAVKKADVRVLAATNRDLARLVREGRFREDLYYRLDVYRITVPPLRERAGDIEALALHFLDALAREMDKPVAGFEPDALAAMNRHRWPGNVRELHNSVERALLSCRGTRITLADLPERVLAERAPLASDAPHADPAGDLDAWLAAQEKQAILDALQACDGVQARAAERLGISERSLWHRIKKLDIRVRRRAEEGE